MAHVLDEDAQPGRRRHSRHHGGRRGQHHGAGAGDDEEGDDRIHVFGEPPAHPGDHQHRGGVESGIAVDDPHHGGAAGLGLQDHILDLAQRGVLAHLGDPELHGSGQVLGAGEDFGAFGLFDRHGFTGDGGLIHGALARNDHRVHGEVFAGTHPDDVSHLQIGDLDFLLAAVDHLMGGVGREFDEFLDGTLGAAGGPGLDDDGHQQEEGDDARHLEVAACQRSQDGQRHQFVHVDLAAPQVLDRRDDDGQRQHHGAAEGAQLGGVSLRGEEVPQQKGVQRQQTAGEGEEKLADGPVVPHAVGKGVGAVIVAADAGVPLVFMFMFMPVVVTAEAGLFFVLVIAAAGALFGMSMFSHFSHFPSFPSSALGLG